MLPLFDKTHSLAFSSERKRKLANGWRKEENFDICWYKSSPPLSSLWSAQHLSAARRATTVHKVSYAMICHSFLVHLKYYSCKVCYRATATMVSKTTFSSWMKRFTFCPTLRKKVTGKRLLNVTAKRNYVIWAFLSSFSCSSSHITTANWYQRSLLRNWGQIEHRSSI